MIPMKPPPRLEDESKFSSAFVQFIAKCLVKEPSKRPSAKDLLQDSFITGASNDPSIFNGVIEEVREKIATGALVSDDVCLFMDAY